MADNDDGLESLREVAGTTPLEDMFDDNTTVVDCMAALAGDPWTAELFPGDHRLLKLPEGCTLLNLEVPVVLYEFESHLKKGYNKTLKEEVKHLQELQKKLIKILNSVAVVGGRLDAVATELEQNEPDMARVRRLVNLARSDVKKVGACTSVTMGKSQEITLNVVRKSAGLSKAAKKSVYSVTSDVDREDLDEKREEDNKKALRSLAANSSRQPSASYVNPLSAQARYYNNFAPQQNFSFGGRGWGNSPQAGGGRGGRGNRGRG